MLVTFAVANSKQAPMARGVVVVAADIFVLRDFILPPLRKVVSLKNVLWVQTVGCFKTPLGLLAIRYM